MLLPLRVVNFGKSHFRSYVFVGLKQGEMLSTLLNDLLDISGEDKAPSLRTVHSATLGRGPDQWIVSSTRTPSQCRPCSVREED